MMTQSGRVVYDRKKNPFKPRDVARIIDSYSVGYSAAQFAEFCLSLLELTIDRRPRLDDYKITFWRYFLNSFNRAALEEIFLPPQWREGLTPGDSEIMMEKEKEEPEPKETVTDTKKERQKGALK